MAKKTFTASEANALLPELKDDLLHLQILTGQFENLFMELQKKKAGYKHTPDSAKGGKDPFFEEESRIEFMRMEVDVLIDNFARKGVLLKAIKPGLIDFPAVLDGKDVLICWREEEDRVTHYHGWNDGYVGRKPLPDSLDFRPD